MSDENRPGDAPEGDVPGFDDPAYDDLRALLAGARVREPMPAEVADRLDGVLAGLRAEAVEEALGPVVALESRRRRTGVRMLTAAAAVVAVAAGGVGLGQVLDDGRSASSDKAATAESAGGSGGSVTSGDADGPVDRLQRASVPQVHAKTFAADAARLLVSTPAAGPVAPAIPAPSESARTQGYSADEPGLMNDLASKAVACTPPAREGAQTDALAGSTSSPVLLDGKPATLVVHPPARGKRLVQAWSCDGTRVLASATVPR
ncbi:MAG: hypothetical protein J7518_12080 [Nocardioidaceae bacterium]|nr:hypothetical protein [Nocardioidaceae bacterium]